MPDVSIIIPVYNVEKYIRQSLESVVNQTYRNIEIICIDDCSTDSSLEILKEYSKKDSRFRIIEQQINQGQGIARNIGIENAKGNYIMFLDPDDWLEYNAVELAYNQIIKNNNDIVYFNLFFNYEDTDIEEVDNLRINRFKDFLDRESFSFDEIQTPFQENGECWYKIYSTAFLKDNNIKFYKSCFAEDIYFYNMVLLKSKSASIINIPLYHYRQRNNSSMSIKKNKDNYKKLLEIRDAIFKEVLKSNKDMIYINMYIVAHIKSIMGFFLMWYRHCPEINQDYYEKMQKIFKELDYSYDMEEIRPYIPYKRFKYICEYSLEKFLEIKLPDKDKCTQCNICYEVCNENSIEAEENKVGAKFPVIKEETCNKCRRCMEFCPIINPINAPNVYENSSCDYLIVNFWQSFNYGSILTGFALQKLIKSLGFDTKLLWIKDRKDVINSFAKKFLEVTPKLNNIEAKEYSQNIKQGIILGSDLVLNTEKISSNKNIYSLNFAENKCRKISLSASFGENKNDFLNNTFSDKNTIEIMKNAIKSFDYISVRELLAKEIIKDVFNSDSDIIIDPVFLLNKQKYEDIISTSFVNTKNKILCYIKEQNTEELYAQLENETGKKIYELKHPKNTVEDFLKSIKDCEILITDSYYAICFALIFNKPFICIKDENTNKENFSYLKDLFNISDNFAEKEKIIEKINNCSINYEYVNKIINSEKAKSLALVEKVIKEKYSNNPNSQKNKIKNKRYIQLRKTISLKHKLTYTNYIKYKVLANLAKGEKLEHYIQKKKRLKEDMEIMYENTK